MTLDTLDRSPPPFFRQGLSALSRLVLFGLLSVFLMAADHRLGIGQPVRSTISLLLTPMEWLVMLPGRVTEAVRDYASGIDEARDAAQQYHSRTIAQAQRLQQTEQLMQENQQLRELLDLQQRSPASTKAVQALYETADPYTHKLVISKGSMSGIEAGSAVIDVAGVVGQVTRVYPLVSEVTLLTDRDQSIPVLNTRTGQRYVAFGDPATLGGSLELRFVPASAELQSGDLLTTSGIDGVYPAGLHVARIDEIDRRVDNSFAKVHAVPVARNRGRHMLVLPPNPIPAAPASKAVVAETTARGPSSQRKHSRGGQP